MELQAPNPRRELQSILSPPPSFLIPNMLHCHFPFTPPRATRRSRSFPLTAAPSSAERKLDSWVPVDRSWDDDGFGGWSVTFAKPENGDKNALPRYVVAGAGAGVAILLAAFTYFSFSKKGFKFRFDAPYHTLYELMLPSKPTQPIDDGKLPTSELSALSEGQDNNFGKAPDSSKLKDGGLMSVLGESKHIVIPVAADSTQQEALFVLKKLQIIENDINGDELCTRREYTRWLVKANSMLERSLKYKIVPSISVAGSLVTAFDDVSVNDPDFWFIQALGETGIVFSKLSAMNSSSSVSVVSSDDQGRVDFFPNSYISRLDLLNWRSLLEYPFISEIDDKMLRKKVAFLDLSAIIPHASPQLLIDLMADEESISRRVFGNIRRLQPQKLVTKAQAAVAITSGRMIEAIHTELSRLDAENLARLAEMDEIRSELISKGEIQRPWEEKMEKERGRGFEVERDLNVALHELEKEKKDRNENFPIYMKDKASLECQQQLLLSLSKEIDGVHERLANERANFIDEQHSSEELLVELHEKQEAMAEAKSFLEAEKEALQILRSWLEEEAQRIHERAEVLEQAAQRWRWSDESASPWPFSSESSDSQTPKETDKSREN